MDCSLSLQHDFDVSWKHKGEAVRQSKAVASLQAIPLRWGTRPTVILAAGDYDAVVVSEKGHLLDRFAFPVSPRLSKSISNVYMLNNSPGATASLQDLIVSIKDTSWL